MALSQTIMMWAIPGFFILMAIEWLASTFLHRPVYRLNDAINSISLGILSQVIGVFTKLMNIGIYALVLGQVALFDLPLDRWWVWLGALLLYDFCYYWLHRCGHEVGILWAAHVVHHQSERYNLSTALRQTSSSALLGWLFYLPLAVLGVPLEVFATVAVIDLIYQYWIHTELVGKLGWFDRVFASPSNHRVHHAVNERYLDRNYGGILILWDRLFGTFSEEDPSEPVVYGTRAPLRSWNPVWANLEVYWALLKDSARAGRFMDRIRVWLKPPGWRPGDVAERFPKPEFDITRREFDPVLPRAIALHAALVFVVVLLAGVQFLQTAGSLPGAQAVTFALSILMTLWLLGALMEGRRGAYWLQGLWLGAAGTWLCLVGGWFGDVTLPPGARIGVALVTLLALLLLAWGATRRNDGLASKPDLSGPPAAGSTATSGGAA